MAAGSITGTIYNARTSQAITDQKITVVLRQGDSGADLATTRADANGHYTFNNILNDPNCSRYKVIATHDNPEQFASATSVEFAVSGSVTQNLYLPPALAVGQMMIVLSWNGQSDTTAKDLDSHLYFGSNEIYYGNSKEEAGVCRGSSDSCKADNECPAAAGSPPKPNCIIPFTPIDGAALDVDQVWWDGPETISILAPLENTTYIHRVNNYWWCKNSSGEWGMDGCSGPNGTLHDSGAVVRVYVGKIDSRGRQVTVVPDGIPAGGIEASDAARGASESGWWNTFTATYSEDGVWSITNINSLP